MEKTILVPTDFKVQSLNTLKLALAGSLDTHVKVVLMYSEIASDSISDLLFYSPLKRIEALIKPEFEKALAILKNRFEKALNTVSIELLNGYNSSLLENFLAANKIDEIYIPKNYKLNTEGLSFNPVPLIKNTDLPVYEMDWEVKKNVSEEDQVDALFN